MRDEINRLVLVGTALLSLSVGAALAQQTTTTETKKFTVIAVEGNQLVVRLPEGTREITVPDDFRFIINGQPMSVRELKPGMSGTATITTTTTVKPVVVTEVKNGTVERVMGSSVLVKSEQGFRMFSEGDVEKRGVKIYKDGKQVGLTDLHAGDHLTATIVTEKPPQVMTERQVQATLAQGGAAAGAPAAAARPAAGAAAAPAGPSAAAQGAATPAAGAGRALPKTASPLPLLGLVGAASATVGVLLTSRRRRRTTK